MALKMNKDIFIQQCPQNYTLSQKETIYELLCTQSLVGRKNKQRFILKASQYLTISQEQAQQLYNQCASIWLSSFD